MSTLTPTITLAHDLTVGTVTPYGVVLAVLLDGETALITLAGSFARRPFPASWPVITLGQVDRGVLDALLP